MEISVQIFHLSAPMIGAVSFSVRRIVARDGFGLVLKTDTKSLSWTCRAIPAEADSS